MGGCNHPPELENQDLSTTEHFIDLIPVFKFQFICCSNRPPHFGLNWYRKKIYYIQVNNIWSRIFFYNFILFLTLFSALRRKKVDQPNIFLYDLLFGANTFYLFFNCLIRNGKGFFQQKIRIDSPKILFLMNFWIQQSPMVEKIKNKTRLISIVSNPIKVVVVFVIVVFVRKKNQVKKIQSKNLDPKKF